MTDDTITDKNRGTVERPERWFASDNNAAVHPAVMEALLKANRGHAIGYGDDPWTTQALSLFADTFGPQSQTLLLVNGTGANVMAVCAALRPWEAVICADSAHLDNDETGAPEHIAGIKLFPVKSSAGKLDLAAIEDKYGHLGWVHSNLPRMVSLTQPTETGLVYTPDELETIAAWCHKHGLFLHIDGARIANAAQSLGTGLKEAAGPFDYLSFGGTKNGLLCGEALVVRDSTPGLKHLRKNILQLTSKMRYLAAQFLPYLGDGLWKENASRANSSAARLAAGLNEQLDLKPAYPVQTNAVFVPLDLSVVDELRRKWFFYTLDGRLSRFMCSWDNTADDIQAFLGDFVAISDKKDT